MAIAVLDLFSAAAGGWSLGMHRAGFTTVAACEAVEWRRILYNENNPGVPVYDDVRTLTADRLLRDIGELPSVIVGSPPCQDISSANTKGKGVEGERSGLYFEAVRLIGECRPRWFALENSANLRTRGADAVLAALEAIGYACWSFVVRAGDIGANHERPRSWLIGCDLEQVADPHGDRWPAGWSGRGFRGDIPAAEDPCHAEEIGCGSGVPGRHTGATGRAEQSPCGDATHTDHQSIGRTEKPGTEGQRRDLSGDGAVARNSSGRAGAGTLSRGSGRMGSRNTPNPNQARQADGCLEPGLRQAEIADNGCGDGRGADRPGIGQMGLCPADCGDPDGSWPLWSLDDLAARIRLDDGLPARVAGTRVAVGGPRGTTAASLIVEAYGDAVVPQIPEAIGRAILRVEEAMAVVLQSQRLTQ